MTNPRGCTEATRCSNRSGVDRRTVLRVGATGSLMVVTLSVGCGGDAPMLSAGPIVFPLNVSAVPVGFMMHIPAEPGFLARDARGLYAMSAVCTHLGCLLPAPLTPTAPNMTCHCHDSQFDRNGTVVKGPAQLPLQHYRVDLAANGLAPNGTITIQGNIPVDSDVRTPVV